MKVAIVLYYFVAFSVGVICQFFVTVPFLASEEYFSSMGDMEYLQNISTRFLIGLVLSFIILKFFLLFKFLIEKRLRVKVNRFDKRYYLILIFTEIVLTAFLVVTTR